MGGIYLSKLIAEKLNLDIKEAEKLKRMHGLSQEDNKSEVTLVLQKEISKVVNKAKSIIDFYESNNRRKVRKVLLVGGSSLMPGLSSYFKLNLGVETKIGDPSAMYPGLNKIIRKELLIRDIVPKNTEESDVSSDLHPVFFLECYWFSFTRT